MAGVTRYDQKTLNLYEVEIGSMKALFNYETVLVVFDGTKFFVTDAPKTGRIESQIGNYLAGQVAQGFHEARFFEIVPQGKLEQIIK
jgi:hypothetical protein